MGLVDLHLEWCVMRGLRPATIDAKRGALTRLGRTLPVEVEHATAAQLYDWWRDLPRAPQSQASEISHIRQYFLWLRREGHRDDDPTVRLDAPRVLRRLPRPISDDHLATAIGRANEPIRAWLYAAALAGLRACEIAPLRAEDLQTLQEPHTLYVADGKGGRDRLIPLHPLLLAAFIRADLPASGYLWPTPRGHISAGQVSKRTNRHLHSVGVSETTHQLRHFFGTKFYVASGRDLRATQEVMGHQTPASTANYTRVDVARASRSVAAITL